MSELAYNINGEAFDLPATATGWRVRRMKPRGAPEVVYGRDGVPLIVPAEAGLEELRHLVGAPGRYRLDAIDDRGRTIDKLPASYVLVPPSEHDAQAPAPEPRSFDGASNTLIAEAMRLNTEIAKAVVDRFPQMLQSAAELLRAADGAGLPARQPREVVDADDEGEDRDDADRSETPSGFDFNALLAQLMPVLVTGIANGKLQVPNLGELLDWRKAAAKHGGSSKTAKTKASASTTSIAKEPLGPGDVDESPAITESEQATGLPPIDPATIAHFVAVQAMLTPEESALAREVAAELKPAEVRAWFDELSKLDVAEAAAKIRKVIGGAKGGAS